VLRRLAAVTDGVRSSPGFRPSSDWPTHHVLDCTLGDVSFRHPFTSMARVQKGHLAESQPGQDLTHLEGPAPLLVAVDEQLHEVDSLASQLKGKR